MHWCPINIKSKNKHYELLKSNNNVESISINKLLFVKIC